MANRFKIHSNNMKTDINFKFQQNILFILENKFLVQIYTEIRVPLQIILIYTFSGSIFIKISWPIGISAGNSNQTCFRFQSVVVRGLPLRMSARIWDFWTHYSLSQIHATSPNVYMCTVNTKAQSIRMRSKTRDHTILFVWPTRPWNAGRSCRFMSPFSLSIMRGWYIRLMSRNLW